MGSLILNVVIVLGIIIAGGFLIFFLGDLLISIIDPKGEEERIKNKKKENAKKFAKKVEKLPEEQKEEIKEDPEVQQIIAEAEEPKQGEAPTPIIEDLEEEKEPEEMTEEEKLAEARAALEKRKAEILARMQAQLEEDEDEEEEEEEDEEEEEEVEETVEVAPASEEEAALREELAAAKRALEEERARYAALEARVAQPAVTETSREELERNLAELEVRLRDNEKELKACKKEYLPLARVNKTLENDEKKLRRKEAIVAKQKVLLYGVNNYEDIDPEKAKKLAEDLDLLDGLKLSVQHCHEVMDKNKDRFPVLEKMYFILKSQNEQLRADILEIQQTLQNMDEE